MTTPIQETLRSIFALTNEKDGAAYEYSRDFFTDPCKTAGHGKDNLAADSVIGAFARENRATYIVNLKTGTFRIYGDIHNINSEMNANKQFADAMHRFAENYIHPSDRAPFLAKFGDFTLLKNLPEGATIAVEYRCNAVSREYTWSRVTGQRISSDTFLAGFKGIDEEVLQRIVSEKLIGDYEAIYVADLDRDEIRSAHPLHKEITGVCIIKTPYTSVIQRIAETASPAFQEDWQQFAKPAYMKEYMANSDHREYVYELPGEKRVMRRFTVDVLERTKGAASVLLLSFTAIDDVSAEILILQAEAAKLNEQLSRRIAISDYFLRTFDTAYYVTISTGKIEVLHSSENSRRYADGKVTNCRETLAYYVENIIHPQDKEMFRQMLDTDNVIRTLAVSPEFSFIFHDALAGLEQTFRCTVIRGEDADHAAVAFKNVTEEIEAEKRMMQVTKIASQDALTGVGSSARYMAEKAGLNREIETGTASPFAVVECDANNLKEVNDGFGHEAGDAYLKTVCRTICDIYAHSKVFRTGGDEFVVLLQGRDYEHRDELFDAARKAGSAAKLPTLKEAFTGVSFACGMGVYQPGTDTSVDSVFRRADAGMYEHKMRMKTGKTRE